MSCLAGSCSSRDCSHNLRCSWQSVWQKVWVFLLLLICFEGFSGTASWVFFWSPFPHFLMGFALLSLLLPDFFPSPVLFCSVSLTVLFLGFTLGSFVWRVWYYIHGTTCIHGMCVVVVETSFVVVLGGGFVLVCGRWGENPTLGFWI
jgi:hypothetical protein